MTAEEIAAVLNEPAPIHLFTSTVTVEGAQAALNLARAAAEDVGKVAAQYESYPVRGVTTSSTFGPYRDDEFLGHLREILRAPVRRALVSLARALAGHAGTDAKTLLLDAAGAVQ